MLKTLDLRGVIGDLVALLPRPSAGEQPIEAVRAIIAEVRAGGDAALRACTERFDGVKIDELRVPTGELSRALDNLAPELVKALEMAKDNIESYHLAQVTPEIVHRRDGIEVRDLRRCVERAGLYVPGGRAAYPSTVLMTAIPAKVAGVSELALCVPPDRNGVVPEVVLGAACLAGVDEVYRVGGAQAIAAMAYGTESIKAVDVIVGPGNVYVAVAKREVSGVVGIPSAFAGPSEVVVVADETTPVDFAAIDIVLQAEHGPNGLAWLITWDEGVLAEVADSVTRIVEASPRRDDIESTLSEGGYAVICDGPEQAMAVANAIAPEHLELLCENPGNLLASVQNAGAVFCGPWSPASVGDYMAGPNHVLPTFGSARFSGALRVDDFIKHVHVVTLDESGLRRVAPHVETLATAEGLVSHGESVRMRVQALDALEEQLDKKQATS